MIARDKLLLFADKLQDHIAELEISQLEFGTVNRQAWGLISSFFGDGENNFSGYDLYYYKDRKECRGNIRSVSIPEFPFIVTVEFNWLAQKKWGAWYKIENTPFRINLQWYRPGLVNEVDLRAVSTRLNWFTIYCGGEKLDVRSICT